MFWVEQQTSAIPDVDAAGEALVDIARSYAVSHWGLIALRAGGIRQEAEFLRGAAPWTTSERTTRDSRSYKLCS